MIYCFSIDYLVIELFSINLKYNFICNVFFPFDCCLLLDILAWSLHSFAFALGERMWVIFADNIGLIMFSVLCLKILLRWRKNRSKEKKNIYDFRIMLKSWISMWLQGLQQPTNRQRKTTVNNQHEKCVSWMLESFHLLIWKKNEREKKTVWILLTIFLRSLNIHSEMCKFLVKLLVCRSI